jgi:transcriptional regulator with XRE-family HTH domain
MNISSETLAAVIKDSVDPVDFIERIGALQGLKNKDIAKKAGITRKHFAVMKYQIKNNEQIPGIRTCDKLAKGINISFKTLWKIICDYKLQKYLKQQKP